MNYVLNVRERPDRLEQFFRDVPFQVEHVFHAVPAADPFMSFNLSMQGILQHFVESKQPMALVFEDDAIFSDLDPFVKGFAEMPIDWDLLYLGGNISDGVSQILENQPVKFSQHLVKVKRCWTTHAILYSARMAEKILAQYDPKTCGMYDDWLSKNMLAQNNCFMVNPMVATQRPGISDLWNRETDYSGAWKESNEKMSRL